MKTLLTKGLKKSYELGPGKVKILLTAYIIQAAAASYLSLFRPLHSLFVLIVLSFGPCVSGYSWYREENG